MQNQPIDIVIPWVDGSDPEWRLIRDRYMHDAVSEIAANTEIRYQDWGNLRYWFRAIRRTISRSGVTTWYHRIFFITWGHLPDFIDRSNDRLRIVKHDEYIPQEYLPTFNSNTIEMNLHRIKELSENFVLFNDDLFPLQEIPENYYFKDDLVCDQAVESPIMPVDIGELSRWSCMVKTNDLLVINRHFRKREVQKKYFWKWFSFKYGERIKRNIGLHYWNNFVGFHDPHMANAMKKSTLKKIWEKESELLDQASRNRFRDGTDISQYLIRYWQLCEGEFTARKTLGKPFTVTVDNCKCIADGIRNQKWQMVSLSEKCTTDEFEIIKKEVNSALAKLLSEKSSLEI